MAFPEDALFAFPNAVAEVTAVSADGTEIQDALATTGCVLPSDITNTQLKQVALSLLQRAGALPEELTITDGNSRGAVKAKGSLEDKENLWDSLFV